MLFAGCDTTVPLFENPQDHPLYYSLYGRISYPDGGTIRVEPLRDSTLRGAPGEASEVVTFTKGSTGEVDTLEVHSRQVDQLPVRNYRTPGGLEAGATYQIRVEGPDGNASSAQVTLPERRPTAEVLDSLRYCRRERTGDREVLPVRARIDSVRRLGRLALQYTTRFGLSSPYLWTNAARAEGADTYRIRMKPNDNLVDIAAQQIEAGLFEPPPPAIARAATLTAVAVGPEWPGEHFNKLQLKEMAAPIEHSNVQQGTGLVLGTRSVTVDVPVKEPDLNNLPPCSD